MTVALRVLRTCVYVVAASTIGYVAGRFAEWQLAQTREREQ